MPAVVLALDIQPAPYAVGTLVRVIRSARVGRVRDHGTRYPGAGGRYYVVSHEGPDEAVSYWEHEVTHAVAETYQDVMKRMRSPMAGYKSEWRLPPEESFKRFRELYWDTLTERHVGGASALAAAYMNAAKADDLLRKVGTSVAGSNIEISDDLNHGSVLALGAAQMVNSALLTHLRLTNWYEHATLLMLRTALEMAGAAALFAVGPAEQRTAWSAGQKISPTKVTLPALRELLRTARTDAPDPMQVYGWLSEHVHFTKACIDGGAPDHEEAYAALAYVAWCTAVVTEAHVGLGGIATWPHEWPKRLPWEAKSPTQ